MTDAERKLLSNSKSKSDKVPMTERSDADLHAELEARIGRLERRIANRREFWKSIPLKYETLEEAELSWKHDEKDLQFYRSIQRRAEQAEAERDQLRMDLAMLERANHGSVEAMSILNARIVALMAEVEKAKAVVAALLAPKETP